MIEKLVDQLDQMKMLLNDIHKLHLGPKEISSNIDLKKKLKAEILLKVKKGR